MIDFDTGKTAHYPNRDSSGGPFDALSENVLWAVRNGFDADVGVRELTLLNLASTPLDRADWDSLSRQQLIRMFQGGMFRLESKLKDIELPATYGFHTREDSLGILQIIKFSPDGQEVTVRFKLARRRTESAAASTELWAPTMLPGEKPDPNKIREEAVELMKLGQYEEALQRQIWYHHHALEFQPGLSAVRLSFGLSDWMELGRRYPKAKQVLIETRDQKTREFDEGRGYSDLFQDVASINQFLGMDDATSALFKRLQQNNPTLARQCFHYARDALAQSREYELYSRFIPDVQAEYDRIRWFLDDARKRADSQQNDGALRRSADQQFATKARQLIDVLVGAGRTAEAERVRVQAVSMVNDPQLKTAGTDGKTKAE
ncbi:MAG: hypothetical protein EXS31_02575 [Pedosphaera sp.]|nr:hypothetical protein [Pedosphaera sp.]